MQQQIDLNWLNSEWREATEVDVKCFFDRYSAEEWCAISIVQIRNNVSRIVDLLEHENNLKDAIGIWKSLGSPLRIMAKELYPEKEYLFTLLGTLLDHQKDPRRTSL